MLDSHLAVPGLNGLGLPVADKFDLAALEPRTSTLNPEANKVN